MRAPPESLRPMTGTADLGRPVHDLDDLLAEDLAERAAEDGEVLGEDSHLAAVDLAVAGDDAVAVGPVLLLPELATAVPGVLVHLDERALVEEHRRCAPSGGLLALGVLLLDSRRRPGVGHFGDAATQLGKLAGGCRQIGGGSGRVRNTIVRHDPNNSLVSWRFPWRMRDTLMLLASPRGCVDPHDRGVRSTSTTNYRRRTLWRWSVGGPGRCSSPSTRAPGGGD
jgi:hypothetical protein